MFSKKVRNEISWQLIKVNKYKNPNKAEFQALDELANNPHILIKKSDKGSALAGY